MGNGRKFVKLASGYEQPRMAAWQKGNDGFSARDTSHQRFCDRMSLLRTPVRLKHPSLSTIIVVSAECWLAEFNNPCDHSGWRSGRESKRNGERIHGSTNSKLSIYRHIHHQQTYRQTQHTHIDRKNAESQKNIEEDVSPCMDESMMKFHAITGMDRTPLPG